MHAISLCALAIVAIIAPLSAQSCCFPLQWEGQQSMYDVSCDRYTRSRLYSDFKNKRIASYSVLKKHGVVEQYSKTVADLNTMMLYFIYKIKDKTICQVSKIRQAVPANLNCMPASFKFMGGYHIGAGNESLALKTYAMVKRKYKNYISVTKGCIPVRDRILFTPKTQPNLFDISWYNITIGIKNQDVFNLPPACYEDQSFNILQHIQAMGLAGRMGIEQETARLFDNIEIDQSTHHSAHNIYRHLQSSMHKIVDQTLAQANMAKMSALDRDNLFLKL